MWTALLLEQTGFAASGTKRHLSWIMIDFEGCDLLGSPLFAEPGQTNTTAKTPRSRRFAVFLKQLCAALLFCGTDWAVVAFIASYEQEAINV